MCVCEARVWDWFCTYTDFSLAYPYKDRLIKSVSTLSLLQNVQQMFVFG